MSQQEKVIRLSPSLLGHYYHLSCDRFLSFKVNGVDRIRWCFKKQEDWFPFSLDQSILIEVAFQAQKPDFSFLFQNQNVTIKFSDFKMKFGEMEWPVARGDWFWHKQNKQIPFDQTFCVQLHALNSLKSRSSTYVGEINAEKATVTLIAQNNLILEINETSYPISRGFDHSASGITELVGEAHKESGEVWEELIISDILVKQKHKIYQSTNQADIPLSQRKLSYKDFINILKTIEPDTESPKSRCFVYQPSIIVPASFYTRFSIPNQQVAFSQCYPDLLELVFGTDASGNKTISIIVIDAKASSGVKLSHRIQVGIYALYLEEIIVNEKLNNVSLASFGGVWLRPDTEYKRYNLLSIKRKLNDFFSFEGEEGKLKNILKVGIGNESWHLTKKCSGCDFLDICLDQAKKQKDVSLLGFSKEQKQRLNLMVRSTDPEKDKKASYDIEETYHLLKNHPQLQNSPFIQTENEDSEVSELISGISKISVTSPKPETVTLASHQVFDLWTMKQKIDSWVEQKPKILNRAATNDFTKFSNFSVSISVLKDKPTGQIYCWSIFVQSHMPAYDKLIKDMARTMRPPSHHLKSEESFSGKSGYFITQFLYNSTSAKDQKVKLLCEGFIYTLHSLLKVVDDYNVEQAQGDPKKNWKKLISLQCYAFSAEEQNLVTSILMSKDHTQFQKEKEALLLLFCESPEITFQSVQPDLDSGSFSQLINLKSVIKQLLVLPVPFNFDFDDIHRTIAPKAVAKLPVGSSLNGHQILETWYKNIQQHRNEILTIQTHQNILSLLVARSKGIIQIVNELRRILEEHSGLILLKNSRSFTFREQVDFEHPILSKLVFLIKYEQFFESRRNQAGRSSVLQTALNQNLISDRLLVLKPTNSKTSKGRSEATDSPFKPATKAMPSTLESSTPEMNDLASEVAKRLVLNDKGKEEKSEETSEPSSSGTPIKEELIETPTEEIQNNNNTSTPVSKPTRGRGRGTTKTVETDSPGEKPAGRGRGRGRGKTQETNEDGTPVKSSRTPKKTTDTPDKSSEPSTPVTSVKTKPGNDVTLSLSLFSESAKLSDDSDKPFYPWLFGCFNQTTITDLLKYDDYISRQAFSSWHSHLPFGKINSISKDGKEITVSIESKHSVGNFDFDAKNTFFLFPRYADLLSKWLILSLKELDLIDSNVKVLKELDLNSPFVLWLEEVAIQQNEKKASDPTKNKARIPVEHKAQMTALARRLHFVINGASSTKNDADEELYDTEDNDDFSYSFSALGKDKEVWKAVWKSLYLGIKEARGEWTTSGLYLSVLSNPLDWGRQQPKGQEAPDSISSRKIQTLLDSNLCDLTACQKDVFRTVLKQHLQLIWGPPGSGKTHFLASLISLTAEGHRTAIEDEPLPSTSDVKEIQSNAGYPFRILVVAFTHKAIDHLLAKVLDITQKKKFPSHLPVGRLLNEEPEGEPQGDDERLVPVFLKSGTKAPLNFIVKNQQCVVGGTIWGVRKAFDSNMQNPPQFDLVIIDEASQMLIADTCFALKYLVPSSGRLVLAGDHYQLPPIINGEYPRVEDGEPLLFSSLFHNIQHLDKHAECISMLQEGWRMNASLSEFPGRTIYKQTEKTEHYRPVNDSIANNLSYLKLSEHQNSLEVTASGYKGHLLVQSDFLRTFLDSSKSLVVLVLKTGNMPTSKDMFPQADLIASLTNGIRKLNDHLYGQDDFNFWSEKMLIVAPHHVQRRAIKNSLYQTHIGRPVPSYPWNTLVEPFIETVEKAQGQERETVIVDYGMIDSRTIQGELSFLYNRNRLNVSITRAKTKCLVILSDLLLQGCSQVFQNHEVEEGFTFMQDLYEFAKEKSSLFFLDVAEINNTLKTWKNEVLFSKENLSEVFSKRP